MAEKYKKLNTGKKILLFIATGCLTGIVNGLFGGGGGMIVVPMLVKFFGFKAKKAHATAILIILPLCIISGLLYSLFGKTDFGLLLPVAIGVVGGGVVGALLLSKLSAKWVVIVFSVIMLAAGVKLLVF